VSVLQQHGGTRVLQLFCSYAREDREGVRALLDGVRHLRHQVWVDERLSGGQAWWDEILADLLPPDLAPLQAIDYTAPGPNAAFELAGALYALPPARPLPDPLPDPPPVPISYLSGLSDRVRAATLSLDDQLAVVARLRTAMERPREREAAIELLEAMRQRTDLYHAPALEIDKLLRERPAPASRPVEAPREQPRRKPVSDVPAGWYPDPSKRHKLRYFDGDWTRWASDRGTVVDDPDF
jgi:hypothetical protein